jgi:hypothetical protein
MGDDRANTRKRGLPNGGALMLVTAMKRPPGFKDETGRRFGRLVALVEVPKDKRGNSARVAEWYCRCDCGAIARVQGANLRRDGRGTSSCGCQKPNRTHNMSRNPLYATWRQMCQRCSNPDTASWRNYGGRGITVSEEWLGSGGFERFYAHVGPRPEGLSLDRINNDGNYEPGNVRWATPSEQSRNRRLKVFVNEAEEMLIW